MPRSVYEFFCHACKKWSKPVEKEFSFAVESIFSRPPSTWGYAYCSHCNKPMWEFLCKTKKKRNPPAASMSKTTRRIMKRKQKEKK